MKKYHNIVVKGVCNTTSHEGKAESPANDMTAFLFLSFQKKEKRNDLRTTVRFR